jgi:oligoendopeptidase F
MRRPSSRSKSQGFPDRWNLTDLVKDPVGQFDTYLADLETKVARFESSRTRLAPIMPGENFRQLLDLSQEIAQSSSRLGAYSYLWFSENTKNL